MFHGMRRASRVRRLGTAVASAVTLCLAFDAAYSPASNAAGGAVSRVFAATDAPVLYAPDTLQILPLGGAGSEPFVVRNAGTSDALYTMTAACDAASSCTLLHGMLLIPPGDSVIDVVRFVAPSAYGAKVIVGITATFTASSGQTTSRTASIVVMTPIVGPLVAPKATSPTNVLVEPGRQTTLNFTASTTPTLQATDFQLSASCPSAAGWSCSAAASVLSGVSQPVPAAVLVQPPATLGSPTTAPVTVRLIASVQSRGVTLAADTGVMQAVLAYHTPAVAPKGAAATVASGAQRTDTFTIANRGNAPATYSLIATCGSFAANGCTVSPASVSIAAGGSGTATISYVVPTLNARTDTITLVARYQPSGTSLVEADTGRVVVTTRDQLGPTIAIAPAESSIVTTRFLPVTTTVCDADGVVTAPSMTLNGASLGGSFTSIAPPGCATAGTFASTATLQRGFNTIVATASDGVRTTTITRTIAYNETVEQRPIVAARVASEQLTTNRAWTDSFTVHNPGSIAINYKLSARCPAGLTGCTTVATQSVNAGQTATVGVSYTTGASSARASVALTATLTSSIGASTTSTDSTLLFVDAAAPTVLLSPASGSSVAPDALITAQWCDPDGTLAGHTASLDGVALPNLFTSATVAGCAAAGTSTWSGALAPGIHTVTAIVTDGAGRSTTATTTFTVAAPANNFLPAVTPKAQRVAAAAPGDTRSQTFVIQNTGTLNAQYDLSADCGAWTALGGCQIDRTSITLAPNTRDSTRVSFTVGQPSTAATISLRATHRDPAGPAVADTGSIIASTPDFQTLYRVGIVPDADAVVNPSTTRTISWTVTNLGTQSNRYVFGFNMGTAVLVQATDTSDVIAPGASHLVTITVRTPTASDYATLLTLNVWARSSNGMTLVGPLGDLVALSGISIMAPVPTYRVIATQMTGGDFPIPIDATLTTPFDFTNTGASSANFSYQVTCGGIVLNCGSFAGPLAGTVTLVPGQTRSLPVTSTFPPVAQQLPNASGFAQIVVTGVGPAAVATATSTANYRFIGAAATRGVVVSPASGAITAAPARAGSAPFTITNAGSQSDAFSYTASCTGSVSCAAQTGTTSSLGGGAAATVNVAFQAGSTLGATGAVTLAATSVADPTKSKSGAYAVTIAVAPNVIAVSTAAGNPATAISRGACLTIAASDDAAYECGDLRLVHGLPATMTMNRAHAPTLIYTSAHAHPVTLIAADVTLDGSVCNPNVTVTVRFAPGDTSQRVFGWNAPCGQVATRRLVVPVDEQARSHPTGLYRYTVEARITTAAGPVAATDTTGALVVVDRSTATSSHFGAGWWLDGLEQLLPVAGRPDQLLWIGGDGSTRVYTRRADDTLTYTVQPSLDRPDTLQKFSAVEYRRHLANGAFVAFDGFLRHVATINALQQATRFVWNASNATQLDSIVLPVPAGGERRAYAFSYTAGLLTSVTAPAPAGSPRVTTLVRAGSDLAIADPGVPATHYLSDAQGRVVTRVDRLGDGVLFTFDAASGLLVRVAESMLRTSEDSIRTTFCPAEGSSAAACASTPVDPTFVRTLLDGPRVDVADTTAFYLTRFGAPARIVDALGHASRFERSDPRWPMLTTKTVDPLGHTVLASYDTLRGLVRTTTDLNPNSLDSSTSSGAAITTYDWDAKWDHATRVVSPANVVSRFVYDPATGLRTSQSVGDNGSRLVTYSYYPDTRLLKTVTTLQSASPSVYDYDVQGNLFHSTTPRGLRSTTQRDYLGRDSVVQSPINDVPVTDWRYQAYTYDAQDRVLTTVDSAQTTGPGSPWEALRVINEYDAEGQLTRVTRRARPDPMQLGDIVLAAEFDAVHRKTREFDPNRVGMQDLRRWRYDPAGNAIATTRGDLTVTAEYDPLNRVVHRVVPGPANQFTPQAASDDQRFVYDAAGRMLGATNNYAQIGRAYTIGGRLVLDTLRIASADLGAPNFAAHSYVVQSTYDVAGRRTLLTPPLSLGVSAPVSYRYDATTGDLAAIAPLNRGTFTFSYTPAGLIDSLVEADGTVERHSYDADGRELRRAERSGVVGTIHDESVGLDGRGKRTQVVSSGFGRPEQSAYSYDGLGGAIATNGLTVESTPRDPLGNALFHVRSSSLWEEDYGYEPHSTRLHFITQRLSEDFQFDSLSQSFDLSGDLVQMSEQVTGQAQCAGDGRLIDCNTGERRLMAELHVTNSYDADGHLELAIKETTNDQSSTWPRPSVRDPNALVVYPKFERGVLEEYRYDALGRRVWTRAHRNAYCPGANERDSTSICISTIERAVYDGDAVLAEIRQPGDDSASVSTLEADGPIQTVPLQQFGLVGYVNGPSVDRPLEMDRSYDGNVLTAVLHYQWEGSVDVATTLDGRPLQCGMGPNLPAPSVPCQVIAWPGATQTFGIVLERPTQGAPSWWGTLVSRKQNATGMLDMRSRQYDPRTGRFTQEDPIGLAGGANLYGFAGGDAVNYEDPFGLCTIGKDCWQAVVDHWKSFWGDSWTQTSFVVGSMGFADAESDPEGAGIDFEMDELVTVPRLARVQGAYKRPSGSTTAAQRAAVQGQPCVKCGATAPRMVAGHKTALVVEHYETGTIDKARMRSITAIQPECPTCSAKEGGLMAQFSKAMKELFGLK